MSNCPCGSSWAGHVFVAERLFRVQPDLVLVTFDVEMRAAAGRLGLRVGGMRGAGPTCPWADRVYTFNTRQFQALAPDLKGVVCAP